MRKSKEFNELLIRYESASLSSPLKSDIFQKMKKAAKNFSDWTAVYQYGDSSIRKDAQRKMEDLVFQANDKEDLQLNILELFMVVDEADKDEILRRYLRKCHGKDDLLFALENTSWGEFAIELRKKLDQFYKPGFIEIGLKARSKRTEKLLQRSIFNPWS